MFFYRFVFLLILGHEEKCLGTPNTRQDPIEAAWGG